MKKILLLTAFSCVFFTSAQTAIFNSSITINSNGSVSSPLGEEVDKVIDGDVNTKFLDSNHSDGMTFTVNLGGASNTASSIEISTANDVPARDPVNFEIFGSNDGTNFSSITTGTIPCITTRLHSRTFSFSNSTAYTYYRVSFTTLCGTDSHMQVAEVQLYEATLNLKKHGQFDKSMFKVFPNPNKGSFSLKYFGDLELEYAILIDITGKIITNYDLNDMRNKKDINLEHIKAGVYFLNISSKNSMTTKKVVIE